MSSPETSPILASNGGYPRTGDSSEENILQKTMQAFARGERTIADVLDAENVVTRFLISEQARAGVELLTDGGARWADSISHLPSKFEGIVPGEVRQLPGTPISYRVPRIVAKPKRIHDGPRSLAGEYRFARNALGLLPTTPGRAGRMSIKPVMTGPYTLARFSQSSLAEFSSLEARIEAFEEVLAQEIGALAPTGAMVLHIDEPAILGHPQDWEMFRRAFARLAGARDAASQGGRRLRLALHVYGGEQLPLLDKLQQLPADVLGLDFTSEPALVEALASQGSDRAICAGLVSGSNTALENAGTVAGTLEKLQSRIKSLPYVGPSCGMENLPTKVAFEKFRLLHRLLPHSE